MDEDCICRVIRDVMEYMYSPWSQPLHEFEIGGGVVEEPWELFQDIGGDG